jgi:AhpD family alkylhydroperoxidase
MVGTVRATRPLAPRCDHREPSDWGGHVHDDTDPFAGAAEFVDSRFDPDLTPLHGLAKQLAAQFGFRAELTLSPRLAELLRLRVALLEPCPYCLVLHTREAHRIGIPSEVIAMLPGWRETDVFSEAEKAALAYCEALTSYDVLGFPSLHDELCTFFSEVEVAEIAAVTINMNVWTRLKLAQGARPVPRTTER